MTFSRNGRILGPTNPANILAKRDFYAAPALAPEDIISLCLFVVQLDPVGRRIAEPILNSALFDSAAKAVLLESPELDEHEKDAIASSLLEMEERRLAMIESRAKHVLDRLLRTGVSVLEDPDLAIRLLEFVCEMYYRTVRAREIGRRLEPSTDEGITVLTRILASSMAWSLFVDRSSMPMSLLSNHTGRRFITSDNPAVNILRPDEDRPPTDEEFALYMPLTPAHALIVPPWHHTFTLEESTEEVADALNAWLVSYARETLVARTRGDLEDALEKGPPSDPPSLREWFRRTDPQ